MFKSGNYCLHEMLFSVRETVEEELVDGKMEQKYYVEEGERK